MKTTQCTVWKNCICVYFQRGCIQWNCIKWKYIQQFLLHLYFHYILELIYQLIFLYTYNFYSLTSHDLSHSHSQLQGFQIDPLSHSPLSINSLHSHLHLSSFQRCLLLQTLASNLHLHLHVSCHFMCLFSLVLDIILNSLTFKFSTTSGTHIFVCGSLILLQLQLHLLVLILK